MPSLRGPTVTWAEAARMAEQRELDNQPCSDDRDLPAVEAWLQAMMGSGSTAVGS